MARIPFTRRTALLALAATLAGPVAAQGWPERPITLLVPFAPGASADGIARLLARELAQPLGQQVLVDNRPGGGGATGLVALSKAAPDGYTLGMGATGAIAINPHLPDAPPLVPDKQLQPLGKVADIPLVLVAGAKAGLPTLRSLLDRAKSQEVLVGNTGSYTSQHLSVELLAGMSKTRLVSVPYRGSSPAVTDLLSGQVPVAMVDLTSAAQHIKAGTLKALAVTSPARSKLAPDVPTIAEAGVPDYAASAWMGLFAPKGLPPAVAARLSKELHTVLAKPEVQAQIMALSAEPAYLDGPAFATFIATESKRWGQVIAGLPTPAK